MMQQPNDECPPPLPDETVSSGRITIIESDWKGAGYPRPDLPPEELPTLLMNALSWNDFPNVDSGLHSLWAFAGETTRHIFQHNETEFIESAHETARQFPTSFYGNAFYGTSWKMLTPLNRVGGTEGWIATQVMETMFRWSITEMAMGTAEKQKTSQFELLVRGKYWIIRSEGTIRSRIGRLKTVVKNKVSSPPGVWLRRFQIIYVNTPILGIEHFKMNK